MHEEESGAGSNGRVERRFTTGQKENKNQDEEKTDLPPQDQNNVEAQEPVIEPIPTPTPPATPPPEPEQVPECKDYDSRIE